MHTTQPIESLHEIINVGIGRGASVLNTMLNSHIALQVPDLKFVKRAELIDELSGYKDETLAAVYMRYSGEISGDIYLVFSKKSASQLVTALIGPENIEDIAEEMGAGALVETGNVVLNGVMGSISNTLNYTFAYSVPNYMEATADNLVDSDTDCAALTVLMAKTNFKIQEFDISGGLVLFFKEDSVEKLLLAVEKLIEDLI